MREVRRGAPNTLIGSGINPGAYESQAEAMRLANAIRAAGTDIVYCSGLVPPEWCASTWCYVDPANCDGLITTDSVFFPGLSYSYSTSGSRFDEPHS